MVMSERNKNLIPFCLFLLSITVQIGALFSIFNPSMYFYKYWELALRLRGITAPPIEVFYSSPFYICYVALLQGIGLNYLNIQIIQVLLGAFNCWLIYRAGLLFFSRPVGIIASLATVFYGPLIIYNSALLPAVWVITFNLVSIICFGNFVRERKPGWLIGAGIFIGLSIITRPNSGLFLGLVSLYVLFQDVRIPGPVAAPHSAGRNIAHPKGCGYRLALVALILIPSALVVLPVTIFNYLGSGEFIPVTASGGWVFYCGNNERAKGFDFSPPPELNTRITAYYGRLENEKLSYLEHILSREIAEEKTRSSLSHQGGSSLWFKEGLLFIREHPGVYIKLLVKKILAVANGYEPHDVPEVMDRSFRLRSYPLIGWAVLLPLALLGMIIARPRTGGIILYLYLCAYLISFLIMYVIPRFRLPAVPILLLFAAAAAKRLYENIQGRKWPILAGNILFLALFLIIVNICTSDIRRDREMVRPAFFHEWKGLTAMKRGEWKKAEDEFRKALELNPRSYQASLGLKSLRNE